MKVVRTIVPVGIGAFCIERFVDEITSDGLFVTVYDCGKGRRNSTSAKLKTIIDAELIRYNKTIDFLFLSHFDNDHINGLSYLIQTGMVNNADTTVYLPLIEAPHIFLYEYVNSLHYNVTIQLLKKHQIKIIFVRPDGQFGEHEQVHNGETKQDEEIFSGCLDIDSYTSLHPNLQANLIWNYIPFYLHDTGIYAEFLKYVLARPPYFFTEADFDNFQDWSEAEKRWLKSKYKSFRYSKARYNGAVSPINMNAMLLISDRTNNVQVKNVATTAHLHNMQNGVCRTFAGCNTSAIYASDVGLNNNQYFNRVRVAICNYVVNGIAGLFQIPHHASPHCYNKNIFACMPFEMAFCNCKQGSINPSYCIQYEHDAIKAKRPFIIVDNNSVRQLVQEILLR